MADLPPPAEAETLERDVAEERRRVDRTIEALQHKLTPGQVIDEVIHVAGKDAGVFVDNLRRTIVANPVPAVLIGAGLVWLMLAPHERRSQAASPTAEPVEPSLPNAPATPTGSGDVADAAD